MEYDNDKPRAKMPCGHVISTTSMVGYLNAELNKNLCVIRCPAFKPDGKNCDYEWPF